MMREGPSNGGERRVMFDAKADWVSFELRAAVRVC